MAPKKKRTTKKPGAKKPAAKKPAKKKLDCNHPAYLIATGFCLGNISFAPGTWGSLGAFLVAGFVYSVVNPADIFLGLLVATIIIFFAGMWATEVYLQSTTKKDPSEVVIDEVCGQLLAITLITYNIGSNVIPTHLLVPYLIIFLLFRYFDIWKPWPCNEVEKKFKGAAGVMLDDIVASVYAVVMFYALAVIMMLVLASAGVVKT